MLTATIVEEFASRFTGSRAVVTEPFSGLVVVK